MPPVLSKYKDQNNYLRFNFVVLDVGTKCVRKEFDKQFSPCKLTEVLKKNRYKLERFINKEQKALLYPSPHGQGKICLFYIKPFTMALLSL